MPSARPVFDGELPSVATQRRPAPSTAQLSGMPNQPSFVVADEKVAPTAATDGSPQRTSTSQAKAPAAKSPPSGESSTMWPKRLSGRGFAASTWSALRRVLLVSIT